MRHRFAMLAAVFSIASAFPAAAELEVLDSDTAREVVGATNGIVVVDLYAEW